MIDDKCELVHISLPPDFLESALDLNDIWFIYFYNHNINKTGSKI